MKKFLLIVCFVTLCSTSLVSAQSDDDFDAFIQSLFGSLDDNSSDLDFAIPEYDDEDYDYDDEWDYAYQGSSELDAAIQWMYNNNLTTFDNTDDFEPDTKLSREAAAKFFGVYAANFLQKTESNGYDCSFSDAGEANPGLLGNIKQACRLGLFKGADGKYLPKSKLTNAQAITVLIKALYGEQAKLDKGHWALPYYYKAKELGFLDGLTGYNSDNLDKPATRGEIAQMMFRTRNIQ